MHVGDLIFGMICFIHEVCKQDGTPYPSKTLYALVINLQAYLATQGHEYKKKGSVVLEMT